MPPNFFVIGAPKCGTTTVCNYMEKHPDVYVPATKELNYYAYDGLKKDGMYAYYRAREISTKAGYLNEYANARDEKVVCDFSVSYMLYSEAARRIFMDNSESRLLMIVREPVDRAFSHYMMDYRLGYVKSPLRDLLYGSAGEKEVALANKLYIENSLYYKNIMPYVECFGMDRILVLKYDDLARDITSFMNSIYKFLNIADQDIGLQEVDENRYKEVKNPAINVMYKNHYVRSLVNMLISEDLRKKVKKKVLVSADKPSLDGDLRLYLKDKFRNDAEQLDNMFKLDLVEWYE